MLLLIADFDFGEVIDVTVIAMKVHVVMFIDHFAFETQQVLISYVPLISAFMNRTLRVVAVRNVVHSRILFIRLDVIY